MLINWSIREIDVFLALAETLNYRRAAERVHLSQPAVSGVIARFEQSLEAKLFDRSTRSVRLTAAGQALLEQARLLRANVDAAAQAVRDVVELRSGRVRLAVLPSLAATAAPVAIARFAAAHPLVRLEMLDTLSSPAFDLVRAGQVDFALTAANPDYADLVYTPLVADRFVLLLPLAHRLARGRRPLRWIDTVELEHISMPQPTSVRQYADAAFLHHGRRFEPRYEVEHLATINAMVAAGLGVAALPELAALVARGNSVTQRRLVDPDLPRPIGLVTPQGRSLSPAAAAMVALLKEEIERLVSARVTRR
ncbi:LysR family transcriptional regulator [Aquincola sp. S2]|uniref:LysR family transcriptional regulator n=1 Tax=Pseudaquabacterium terrae TaxID=2732868 RepID=A0ABX2E9E5_9BURK|nr:LysR family transcriptional regulator [Aquabacterium terrae]NRF65615.1 LysR family transcriptional regulator [Aquabacterium terrae]